MSRGPTPTALALLCSLALLVQHLGPVLRAQTLEVQAPSEAPASWEGTWQGTMTFGMITSKVQLQLTNAAGIWAGPIRIVEGATGRVLTGSATISLSGQEFRINWRVPYGEGMEMVGVFTGTLDNNRSRYTGQASYRLVVGSSATDYIGTFELIRSPESSMDSRHAGEAGQETAESLPQQPYVTLSRDGAPQILVSQPARIAQAKAHGEDLQDFAGDTAVDLAVTEAFGTLVGTAAGAAVTAGSTAGAMAAGAAGVFGAPIVVGWLVGRRQRVTYLWAIPQQRSSTSLNEPQPRFEVKYGDLAWIDPDLFVPRIVKLAVPKSNARLVVATKYKGNLYNTRPEISDFIEEVLRACPRFS